MLDRLSAASSSVDGSFSISIGKGGQLLVTAVGFEGTTVVTGGDKPITIQLKSDAQILADAAVTEVAQATSKTKLSFSMTTVKGSDINIVPQLDASQSLRGRVAGIQVDQSNGDKEAAVFLRGAKSVSGNISPLIVVDGFQTNLTLTDLNPQYIETIEVVKHAVDPDPVPGELSRESKEIVLTYAGNGNFRQGDHIRIQRLVFYHDSLCLFRRRSFPSGDTVYLPMGRYVMVSPEEASWRTLYQSTPVLEIL